MKSRDLSWEAWLLKLGGLGVIGMQLNFTEWGVKSRDLSWEAWLLKLGGLGVIGMQLNFMAIPTSLFI